MKVIFYVIAHIIYYKRVIFTACSSGVARGKAEGAAARGIWGGGGAKC